MTTFDQLAGQAYDAFERRTRDDDTGYTTLRDDAPEWVQELVREAHGDFLPDDWRYASIRSALSEIHDNGYSGADEAREMAHEWADGNVDAYTGHRLAWLASNLNRAGYCDDAADDLGFDPSQGIIQLIGLGQYRESEEIWAAVVDALEEHAAELAQS